MLFISLSEMELNFYKYQGTGNDFILIDNRNNSFPKEDKQLIFKLCDRKFGIGADGLLLLEDNTLHDFTMIYYNADGKIGSMCGNGGRCIIHFANFLNIIEDVTTFEASDGLHKGLINEEIISLKMNDVNEIQLSKNYAFLDTGSPHHVELVKNIDDYDVEKEGASIRYNRYKEAGANINFVEGIDNNTFAVRTYERGVEGETLSCGTGVTAVAIAMYETKKTDSNKLSLKTKGGDLIVKFNKTHKGYSDIYLEGPAIQVYKGIWK